MVKIRELPAVKEPVLKLDYDRGSILLYGGSPIHICRAGSCRKEPETVKWIEGNVKPGDVFYDVGANVGAYSFVAWKCCSGRLTVHAFEPSYPTYYYLCRNIMLNGCQDRIIPHIIALSKTVAVRYFNYHSLEPGDASHFLGDEDDDTDRGFGPVYRQKVISFSIDYLIKHYSFPIPNHIKLDVDGSESDILKGAAFTLNDPHVRSMLVEIGGGMSNLDAMTDLLAKKGFNLASRTKRGGGIFNCIFKRK